MIYLRHITGQKTTVEVLFAVMHVKTGKFIEWISKTKRITYRLNPFKANYFPCQCSAQRWADENGLDPKEFEVLAFTKK